VFLQQLLFELLVLLLDLFLKHVRREVLCLELARAGLLTRRDADARASKERLVGHGDARSHCFGGGLAEGRCGYRAGLHLVGDWALLLSPSMVGDALAP